MPTKKNKITLAIWVFYFLILSLGMTAYAQNDNSNYNFLNFPFSTNKVANLWKIDIYGSKMKMQSDTCIIQNGKHPIVISNINLFNQLFILRSYMHSSFFMPIRNSAQMLVKFTAKSQNIRQAFLVLSGLNKKEEILYSDTLFIHNGADWHTFTKNISIKNVAIMNCSLEVCGIDGMKEQKLWLDKIEMLIDGKNIKDIPLTIYPQDSLIQLKNVQALSLSVPHAYEKLPILKSKRILAFGESIHGSKTINKAVIQLIKYRIEHTHCKLVLIELPIEMTLFADRYIQGDERFHLEAVRRYLFGKKNLLYSEELIDLCKWIKEYNKKTNSKVHLLGYDVSLSESESARNIFNYLSTINQTVKHSGIDYICQQLQENNLSLKRALYNLELNEDLIKVLGIKELGILKYCMESFCKIPSPQLILSMRNHLMWDNADYLINAYSSPSSTVSIYTHIAHANYISDIFVNRLQPSMGALAKKVLKEDYCCIGICVGKGTFQVRGNITSDTLSVKTLSTPPQNSLESILEMQHLNYFYIPSTSFSYPIFMRNIGNLYNNALFEILTPKYRMDGIIYIDNVESI